MAIQVALILAQPTLRCDFCEGNHFNGFCYVCTDFQSAEINYVWNQGFQQYSSFYVKVNKLDSTLQQFIQPSLHNQNSTEVSIEKLEVQVNNLAKQLEDWKTDSGYCQAVVTRSGRELGESIREK